MNVDYIIVGQGIAGSILAWFLSKTGSKVLIIDEFNPNSASQIASGIINPVTGKRLVKSWMIDELLPFALTTYRELESVLGIKIYSEKTICRIFSNREDSQFYRQKMELDEVPESIQPLNNIPECFNDSALGGIEITDVYQLEFSRLLAAMRKVFVERKMLLEEKFQYEKLQLKSDRACYNDIEAGKIIFCEGCDAAKNPWFNWLPFNFAKGEILTVKMPGFPEDKIWHKGTFISPLGNSLFRVGATYDWDFEDDNPTAEGKDKLVSRLKKAVNLPFEIIRHDAAIRPTVTDRRPLIGLHPDFPVLGVFNGFGTKGASLAPFFANQFTDFLFNKTALDAEADIKRFQKRRKNQAAL